MQEEDQSSLSFEETLALLYPGILRGLQDTAADIHDNQWATRIDGFTEKMRLDLGDYCDRLGIYYRYGGEMNEWVAFSNSPMTYSD